MLVVEDFMVLAAVLVDIELVALQYQVHQTALLLLVLVVMLQILVLLQGHRVDLVLYMSVVEVEVVSIPAYLALMVQ